MDHGSSPWVIMLLVKGSRSISKGCSVSSVHDPDSVAALRCLGGFREAFYRCLRARSDALFELGEAVLCTQAPVSSLVGLSLAAEHRRGHGALYDAVANGRVEVGRLRLSLAGLPVPRAG